MAWDSWRVYTETTLHQIANRQGELRPQALLFTKQSTPFSGTYQAIYDTVVADLNEFYYSTGNTHSGRWGVKVYWSNGNEMSNKGMLATTPHSAAAIDSFVTSQRALYDAVHLVVNGQRRFPDAYAGSDPTTEQERDGIVADWLHPSIRYHDFVAWSVYPAGRKDTPGDPTFNFPSHQSRGRQRGSARLHGPLLRAGQAGPRRGRDAPQRGELPRRRDRHR